MVELTHFLTESILLKAHLHFIWNLACSSLFQLFLLALHYLHFMSTYLSPSPATADPTTVLKETVDSLLQFVSGVSTFPGEAMTRGMQREGGYISLCIPPAVACLGQVSTSKRSCSYKPAVPSKCFLGLETWNKVLFVLCPMGDRAFE